MQDIESSWFSEEAKEKQKKSAVKTRKPKKRSSRFGGFVKEKFTKLRTTFKKKVLLKKILFTLLLLTIFEMAATITIPGVEIVEAKTSFDDGSLIGILDLIGGGSLTNLSLVALGISPYITASIIMQLLQTEAFPPVYRLAKSGPAGKRKINIITRILTFAFAYLQAITVVQSFSLGDWVTFSPGFDNWQFQYIVLPTIIVAGSMFALFLGEQITNRGIGNGTSLIIFVGIAADLIPTFRNAFLEFVGVGTTQTLFIGFVQFTLYSLVFLLLVLGIGYIYKSERHIPIQQTGSGLTSEKHHQMSKMPIKINPSGVMPIIFAMSISSLPLTIAQFLDPQDVGRQWIENNLKLTDTIGLIIFVSVTFLFSIVMSIVIFNPERVADNFKKNGTFIPGVRPGMETEEYLTGVLFRLSVFSAFYLSFVTAIPYIEQIIGLSSSITFSGASMIIMVSVSIETWQQVKARDKTSKIAKATTKAPGGSGSNSLEGLLW